MSRKNSKFQFLINYIGKDNNSFVIGHNLRTSNLNNFQSIGNEFFKNYKHCPSRKNGVAMYHEIMSFSGKDTENLDETVLRDLGSRYLETRATNALGYAKVHYDQEHVHIHFIISSNLIESPKKLRLSKVEFKTIKRELEVYQKEKYPFLKHSICQENEVKRKITSKEGELIRKGKTSQKEKVFVLFQKALNCTSETLFFEELKNTGLKLYQRGKAYGVLEIETKKKYRLKTLGLQEAFLKAPIKWKKFQNRSQEINRIKTGKEERQRKMKSHQIS